MTGQGQAYGAITILNATATGIGCSLAVAAGATAQWSWQGTGLQWQREPDDRVARAVLDTLGGTGASAACQTAFPTQRGIKTSSSAAAALLQAAHADRSTTLTPAELVRASVQVCRRAGVTLTGAWDDQWAVVHGGCHLTDNHADDWLASLPVTPWHVAVWVPEARIDKRLLAGLDASALRQPMQRARTLAEAGRVAEAMTLNGEIFTRFYAAAGLPVSLQPARVALAAGALGAGLSGTGPAVAALFDDPADLPAVPGGTWQWTRAVPAA